MGLNRKSWCRWLKSKDLFIKEPAAVELQAMQSTSWSLKGILLTNMPCLFMTCERRKNDGRKGLLFERGSWLQPMKEVCFWVVRGQRRDVMLSVLTRKGLRGAVNNWGMVASCLGKEVAAEVRKRGTKMCYLSRNSQRCRSTVLLLAVGRSVQEEFVDLWGFQAR